MKTQDVISAIQTIAPIAQVFLPPQIAVIAQIVTKYGIPEAQKLISDLGKNEITDQDLKNLRDLVKPPGTY